MLNAWQLNPRLIVGPDLAGAVGMSLDLKMYRITSRGFPSFQYLSLPILVCSPRPREVCVLATNLS